MAQRRMTCSSKLKIAAVVAFFILIVQIVWFLPWLQNSRPLTIENETDGDFPAVNVEVYYEALCPDSKNFVVRQLRPVEENAKRLITVTLIPYGKANTFDDHGNLTFTCQHGPTECLANKVHACAIKSIADEALEVQYISCMIADNYDPLGVGHRCAQKLNIDWEPIEKCCRGVEGSQLLKEAGEATKALRPRVSFIPTILLNGSQHNQKGILKNLFKSVCSLYRVPPPECATVDSNDKSR